MTKTGTIGTGQIPGSVQSLPRITHFAHLLHFQGGGTTPGDATPLSDFGNNPGFLTATNVTRTASLQTRLDDMLAQNPQFRRLKIAIVNLTRDVNAPEYAGFRDLEQGTLGSAGKLSIMYAIFQCRLDLEMHAFLEDLKTAEDVFEVARESWSLSQIDAVSAPRINLFPARPLLERAGSLILRDGRKIPLIVKDKSGATFNQGGPKLEEMFDVAPAARGATVTIKDSFFAQMFQMIPHSDNDAAHFCSTRIGFLFTNSALWQSGLYSPARGGGQWSGGSYGGTIWGPPPVGGDFKQGGTAASLAALHTLIAQDTLVDKAGCDRMRNGLMSQSAGFGGYGSWLTNALKIGGLTRPGDSGFAKIGIADGMLFDSVQLNLDAKGKKLRYVLVALNAPRSAAGEQLFATLAPLLHDIIDRETPQASR